MIGGSDAHARRLTVPLLLLVLFCAFSFGALVRVAFADHFHVTCVPHGFVHGDSLTDGSFFSRVDPGCGSTVRRCDLYTSGSYLGGQIVTGTTATCMAWSVDYGHVSECASTAHVESVGVFSRHHHKPENWCG